MTKQKANGRKGLAPIVPLLSPLLSPPQAGLTPNTVAFETSPLVAPTGFREYDARWLYPKQINLTGMQAVGLGLGTMMRQRRVPPVIITGYDYRAYSVAVHQALVLGLMAAGIAVRDIGLALSPMAYFAQFDQKVASVAMVTASHNENGWTGVKMGMQAPLTFGPEDMARLKSIVLQGKGKFHKGGSYRRIAGMKERYLKDLSKGKPLTRKLKVVVACGNGTAGDFAPLALANQGAEVVPLDCALDYTFPRYNPNPEDIVMLKALGKAVRKHKADVGFAFDGDGDRCGVVDEKGAPVFADKVGLLLARDFCRHHDTPTFIVDVKSTQLFASDTVLKENNARVDYWKTGHSHIKRRLHGMKALAGFEKSGHYFFNPPLGRGYDDGIASAIAVCRMLDKAKTPMGALYNTLPKTWVSPTMSVYCADEKKYAVVQNITDRLKKLAKDGQCFASRAIKKVVTVNGVRIILDDASWALIRASSNKPALVVVVESFQGKKDMIEIFAAIDKVARQFENLGDYDQKI